MNHVFDTTVIIKGLIKPRRKKQDDILKEQLRVYKIASSFMDRACNKDISLIIPNAAIIETACVSARLTGKSEIGKQTAASIAIIATQIISENKILDECIDIGSITMCSGFDSIFIACAKVTDSTLITDDKKMYETAVKVGVKAKLLRAINI